MNLLLAAVLALAAPGGITVSAPAEVHVDAWIPVKGTVRVEPGERRRVRLEESVVGRWHVVERTRATRGGRYDLVERAGFSPQVRTFRVVAPRTDGLRRLVSREFDVRISVDVPGTSWQHPGT
jgi:hypothetical protein